MGRGEVFELEAPEGRDYVWLDHVPVHLEGARAHGAAYGVFQPPLQVFPNRQAPGIEDEPAVPIGHRFGELLAHLLPGLPRDVATLWAASRVDRVGSPVADLLAVSLVLVYRALAVAVLGHP